MNEVLHLEQQGWDSGRGKIIFILATHTQFVKGAELYKQEVITSPNTYSNFDVALTSDQITAAETYIV